MNLEELVDKLSNDNITQEEKELLFVEADKLIAERNKIKNSFDAFTQRFICKNATTYLGALSAAGFIGMKEANTILNKIVERNSKLFDYLINDKNDNKKDSTDAEA